MRRGPLAALLGAAALFGGLALLVFIWAAMEMWVDAYDAALWLLAFGVIELDLTGRSGAPSQGITA